MVEVRTSNQLGDLRDLLTLGGDVSIAVAYVTNGGLDLVREQLLKALRNNAAVKILFGLEGVTSPEAVSTLFQWSQIYQNLLVRGVRKSYNSQNESYIFHAKLCLAVCGDETRFITGSHNLTRAALNPNRNIEHSLRVICRTGGVESKDVLMQFRNLWNSHRAEDLTEETVEWYRGQFVRERLRSPNHAEANMPTASYNINQDWIQFWLYKLSVDRVFEDGHYTFANLVDAGAEGHIWGEELNLPLARNNLQQMNAGDSIVVYPASNGQPNERRAVGTAYVLEGPQPREGYERPTVRVVCDMKFTDPVSREAMQNAGLGGMELFHRANQVSVLPLTYEQWRRLIILGMEL